MSSHIVIPKRIKKALTKKQLKDFVGDMEEKKAQKIPLRVPKHKGKIKEKINKKRKDLMKENIDNLSKSTKKKISPEEFIDTTINRFKGHDEKRKKKIAHLKFQIIEENNKQYSFKPRLNKNRNKSRSRTPLVDRVSKILNDKNKKLNSLRKELSNQKGENEMKECTFQPECRTSPKKQKKSQRDVMKGVERLLDWKKERDIKLMKASVKKKEDSLVNLRKSSKIRSSYDGNLSMVSERLYRKYEVKKKKLEKRKKEQVEGLFHPRINKKSLEIAKGTLRNSRIFNSRITPRVSKTPNKRFKKGETEFKVTPIRRMRNKQNFRKSKSRRSKTRTKKNLSKKEVENRRTRRKIIEVEEEESGSEEDEMIEIPTTFHSERRSSCSRGEEVFSSLVFAKGVGHGKNKDKRGVLGFMKDLCCEVEKSVSKIR